MEGGRILAKKPRLSSGIAAGGKTRKILSKVEERDQVRYRGGSRGPHLNRGGGGGGWEWRIGFVPCGKNL